MANVYLCGFDTTVTASMYAVIGSEFDVANTASWLDDVAPHHKHRLPAAVRPLLRHLRAERLLLPLDRDLLARLPRLPSRGQHLDGDLYEGVGQSRRWGSRDDGLVSSRSERPESCDVAAHTALPQQPLSTRT